MGKSCGSCTLCCKLFGIYEIAKPRGVWCSHCAPKGGCNIYAERPGECRDFVCAWLGDEGMAEEWRPDRSRMVLMRRTNRYIVHVDPSTPDVWKRAPYHEQLMQLVKAGLPHNRLVFIDLDGHLSLLLPDRLEALGVLGPQDEVVLQTVKYPHRTEYRVTVKPAA